MPSARKRTDRKEIRTFAQIAEQYVSYLHLIKRDRRTADEYRRTLSNFCCFLKEQTGADDIRLANRKLVESYADYVLQFPWQLKGKSQWLLRLRKFFRWAEISGLLIADPTKFLPIPQENKRKFPPYISQKEMKKLLESVETDTAEGLRDRAILELLYSTGIRTAEFCRLNLDDVNFADESLRILMGKGAKDRIVPIGKVALHWLARYIGEVRGFHPGALFMYFATPKGIRDKRLGKIIRKAVDAANIKKPCTARNFRHSFAIHLLENGADIRHISAMLGHEHLVTTQKYTYIVRSELKRAHLSAHPAERRRSMLPVLAPARAQAIRGSYAKKS